MVHAFVSEWNGVALLQGVELEKEKGKVEVWTDASGSWGCGALWNGRWSEECCLHGPCYCLGNSSIEYRRVCLAINAVGLFRSSTNNKISVCGWFKLFLFFCFFC